MNGIVGASEPAAAAEGADGGEGEAIEGGEGTQAAPETAAEAVASDLPDDTLIEVEDDQGNKQKMTLKELRGAYRHRSASDRKFSEADKARRSVAAALENAKKDPASVLKWVESQRGDFKTVDFFFKQLEENGDPQVIDRLAKLLQSKLEAEETEQKMTPEARRVRELEKQNEELTQRWEQQQDQAVEQQLFEGVKGAITAAGLNPTPMVAVMALELVAEGLANGMEMTHEEAAALLKDHYRTTAEGLFKPAAAPAAPAPVAVRNEKGQFQTPSKAAPGAAPASAVGAAQRQAKEAGPRVSAIKQPKKPAEDEEPKRMSFLEAIRSSYTSTR